MINRKLVETNHDTTSIQEVIVQNKEGEQMLLKDVSGTFSCSTLANFGK